MGGVCVDSMRLLSAASSEKLPGGGGAGGIDLHQAPSSVGYSTVTANQTTFPGGEYLLGSDVVPTGEGTPLELRWYDHPLNQGLSRAESSRLDGSTRTGSCAGWQSASPTTPSVADPPVLATGPALNLSHSEPLGGSALSSGSGVGHGADVGTESHGDRPAIPEAPLLAMVEALMQSPSPMQTQSTPTVASRRQWSRGLDGSDAVGVTGIGGVDSGTAGTFGFLGAPRSGDVTNAPDALLTAGGLIFPSAAGGGGGGGGAEGGAPDLGCIGLGSGGVPQDLDDLAARIL